MESATVINKSKDKDSNYIGTYNSNPIIDTTVYDVLFQDGTVSQYSTNIIAENVYSQKDEKGYRYRTLDHIYDHRIDNSALKDSDAWVVSKNGRKS